jgi:hypothetical protein
MTQTTCATELAPTPSSSGDRNQDLFPDTNPLTPHAESVTFHPTRLPFPYSIEFYMTPMTLEEYDREYCRKRGFPFWPESDNPVGPEAMTTATSDGDGAELPDAANTGLNHDANRLSGTGASETSGRMRRRIPYGDPCPPGPEVYAPPDDWEGPPGQHMWYGGHRAGDYADVMRSSERERRTTSRLASQIQSAAAARLAHKFWL